MFQEIIDFWFLEIEPASWWKKDGNFDQQIIARFSEIHSKASKCELYNWRNSAEGRLAEIIILDQFSRNMFRDSASAFANDPLALALAQEAISVGADLEVEQQRRSFFYLPFMHSESAEIHEQAVKIYQAKGTEDNMNFELRHKQIIDRFGRYPHRNKALGRTSTAEEIEFLSQPGSSF